MGIKNWQWPLVLLHPELRGVDPFSPDLSVEQRILIALESKANPWYHFREITRIPGSTVETPIMFNANRSNMCLFWLYFNHITVCLEQLRQTGKTFAINTLDAWLLNIGSKGYKALLLTKDEKLRSGTLSEIKAIFELFPPYLIQHGATDIGNREEINIAEHENNYTGLIARNDPVAADKTGRGHKIENVRVDEAAYLFYVEMAIRVMLAATTAARKLAEQKGIPYGNIFATTSGKKDDRDGGYMYNYFHAGAVWSEYFLDCKNKEELDQAVRTASRGMATGISSELRKVLRVHAVFSHRKLGYSDEWLKETALDNGYDLGGDAFKRDYLNIWTSGSQSSPLSVEDADRVRKSEEDIKFGEISRHGMIMTRWYYPDEQIKRILISEHVIMAVDTSDAQGSDDVAVHFRRLKTGETLGAASINEMNLMIIADYFTDFIKDYPKLTMIIERKNQAAAIVDFIHRKLVVLRIDPFRRLYNTCVQDHIEFPERYSDIQNPANYSNENFLAQNKRYFGFITSGSGATARSELYSTTLRAAVKYTGEVTRDKPIIDQTLGLIIKNGRVDHPPGGHDDLVVAWLLSYWFMANGRNLQYYGIPSGYVLSNNQIIHSASNKEEAYQVDLTRRAKEHIDKLVTAIKAERDHYVVERLVMEIENVKRLLGPNHEVSLTVDDMLNQIKKEKISRSHVRRPIFG